MQTPTQGQLNRTLSGRRWRVKSVLPSSLVRSNVLKQNLCTAMLKEFQHDLLPLTVPLSASPSLSINIFT